MCRIKYNDLLQSPEDGMQYLLEEIKTLSKGAMIVKDLLATNSEDRRLIMSVGATPSASSVQNLLGPAAKYNQTPQAESLRTALHEMLSHSLSLELHAGVYPFLVTTSTNISYFSPTNAYPPHLAGHATAPHTSHAIPLPRGHQAVPHLNKRHSLLRHRRSSQHLPKRKPPQALIAAGNLALGREPCAGYAGFGMLSDWGLPSSYSDFIASGKEYSGWEVKKISQEHGLLQASDGSEMQRILEKTLTKPISVGEGELPFHVGQKVRIWPNHACVAAAGFGFYAVVDSSSERPNEVVDIWVRCRGW